MTTDPLMRARSIAALLLAAFVVALGFGIVLPVLPYLVERLAGISDAAIVARHTGLLTGLYMFAIFLWAPLWGKASDKWGRRPIILTGLIGFAISLGVGSAADSLPWIYAGRFLDGAFASAVVPASMALVADAAPSKEWRARRFAWIGMAITAGFFIGPILSGAVTRIGLPDGARFADLSVELTFLLTSAIALIAAGVVAYTIRRTDLPLPAKPNGIAAEASQSDLAVRLLIPAVFATATIGTLEVALALRAKIELGLDPFLVGLMFAECSLVMFVAQAIVFSPVVRPEATRWLIPLAIAVLSLGSALLSFVGSYFGLVAIVAVTAAAAGLLAPVLAYWMSLIAGPVQGKHLGWLSAAASAGQALGSVSGGFIIDSGEANTITFVTLSAVLLLVALWSARLPWRLFVAVQAIDRRSGSLRALRGKHALIEARGAHGSP